MCADTFLICHLAARAFPVPVHDRYLPLLIRVACVEFGPKPTTGGRIPFTCDTLPCMSTNGDIAFILPVIWCVRFEPVSGVNMRFSGELRSLTREEIRVIDINA